MAYCPSCGCKTAEAARFCPMCGVVIYQEAVSARTVPDDGVPRRAEVPQPNDRLIEGYATRSSCGLTTSKAMRVLAVLFAILLGTAGVVGGVMLLVKGQLVGGVLAIAAGIVGALLVYFLMHIGMVSFENLSLIARGMETQHRITVAQLELLSHMELLQDESLRLSRQTVELLKVIDGDRFDAAKQAERQTELLDKLTEQQAEQARRLAELKAGSDAAMKVVEPAIQDVRSWKTESHRFIHAVALAISQLPDRLRDAIAGEKADQPADEDKDEPAQVPEDAATEEE